MVMKTMWQTSMRNVLVALLLLILPQLALAGPWLRDTGAGYTEMSVPVFLVCLRCVLRIERNCSRYYTNTRLHRHNNCSITRHVFGLQVALERGDSSQSFSSAPKKYASTYTDATAAL